VPVELGKARRRVVVAASFFACAAVFASVGWPQAPAAAQSPSDSRARFVEGNVTTCAGVGFAADLQVGSSSNTSAGDAHVVGTVKTNAGAAHAGQGQELDVATLGTGFVIDAIVVKGGPAYNVYTNPSVLPPALGPDQHYISPFNHGGNVPTISHWFICYHAGPAPTTTTQAPTTTAAPTTTTSRPPGTTTPPTTRPNTTTTSTVPVTHVTQRRAAVPPPAASTTTRPATSTSTSTSQPPRAEVTIAQATTASATHPETGASTASFIVGCATSMLVLAVLALRPRR
jgi:hypothetical protein